MKKTFLFIVGTCLLAIVFAGSAKAETFAVSAEIPLSSSVTYTVTELLANGTWTDNHPAGLNFGILGFDSEFGIFKPVRYFAIDIGVATGGVGKPNNIQFSYLEINNPNTTAGNGRGGLAKKGTVTVTKAVLEGDEVVVAGPKMLGAVATFGTLTKAQFVNGWPRVYVGINDGGNDDLTDAGAEVFTAEDAAGTYLGSLTITAVVS